ncbi:MAG: SagB/ThcOx family dehydrogenase [Elusimicrobiota bacterium]
MNSKIKLPKPNIEGEISLARAINKRHSVRSYKNKPLSIKDLSQIIWAAGGLRINGVSSASRTIPSAGGIYPLKFYVLAGNVENVKQGLYIYKYEDHSLERIINRDIRDELSAASFSQSMIKYAPATVVITSVTSKIASRYGNRGANRYAPMECGHSGQNIYLMAESRGISTVAIGAFNDIKVGEVMNLSEDEKPVYIFPVGYSQKQ